MDESAESAAAEVTLFLDDRDLYVTGDDDDAIDRVLTEILGPDAGHRHRSRTHLADAGAVAATVATVGATAEQCLRLTAESAAKLRELGIPFDGHGVARGSASRIAAHLNFDTVSLGAERAVAMQMALVSLALRSAIADVEAAVAAVDQKVSDIQQRVRARQVGEVIGAYRHLRRIVDSTRDRERLLDADWDQVSGVGADLAVALEELRAYVTESVNQINADDPLPKRAKAIGEIASPKSVAGSLQLILVAEQAVHLLEYLRLERVRVTEPEHVESALADAKRALATQRERDAELVRDASRRIEAAQRIDPLEILRVVSIPDLEKASGGAWEALDAFATASRAELPDLDRVVHRPQLSEARDEVKRHALNARDGAVAVSRSVAEATSRGAKRTSDAVRRGARDLFD